MAVCLEVKNLTKSIKGKPIVGGICFEIEEGQVIGFVGPNGAGKTTTMRMIMGLIKKDSGTVHICGYDLDREPKKALANIAGIIEKPCFYKEYSGWDNLVMMASLTSKPNEEYIKETVALLDMESYIDDKAKTYSLGMQQRLGIAISLMSKPKILILDEPLNGLDPIGIRELHKIFKALSEKGTAILISSHLLKEIEEDCSRCIMLIDGKSVDISKADGESLEDAFFRVTENEGGGKNA